MYIHDVFDKPINSECVRARMTPHTYAGTLNRLVWTMRSFLRNAYTSEKNIIMNNYTNKKFTLFT